MVSILIQNHDRSEETKTKAAERNFIKVIKFLLSLLPKVGGRKTQRGVLTRMGIKGGREGAKPGW